VGRRAATKSTRKGSSHRLIDYPRRGHGGLRRWLPSWKLVTGLALTGLLFAVGLFAFAYAETGVPSPNELVDAQTTHVYYADGKTKMGEFAAQDRTLVTSEQIPEQVKQAVVAAEDRSFYENRGVSPSGIARAFWGNLRGNSTQGGSTITQQYVKNYFLNPEQTYKRKVQEAFIAIKIDQKLSKDQILTDYLNTIYFGRGAYGIQSASQAYFGKDVEDLTAAEAALLAGIIPSPSNWDPRVNPDKAEKRFDYVLDGMQQMGYLDGAGRAEQQLPETKEHQPTNTFAGPTGYLLASVRDEVLHNTDLTENDLDRGGLRIVTTIDKSVQDKAVAAVQDPEVFPTEGRPETLQAALVSIDPATGGVLAMYGGPDYLKRQRNAVTQDVAQAGSTFKPFTLVAALEKGISLKTRYSGRSPQTYPGFYVKENGQPAPVRNFGGGSYGDIDLVQATRNSVNTVYVKLNEEVGAQATADVAEQAGIDPKAVEPAVASNVLGTPSVRPLDMAQAYATFAAQGVRHKPHIVATIEQDGGTVYEADTREQRVFQPDVMADATYAMQQVVRSGSGAYASRLNRPVAGKTGTSNDNRSAWFVGYVPQMATAVALYNVGENGEQLEIPGFGGRREITGGSFPVQIWTKYMQGALDGVEVQQFPPRADVGKIPISQMTPTETAEPTTQAPEPTEEPTQEPTTAEPTTEPTQEPTQEPKPQPSQTCKDGLIVLPGNCPKPTTSDPPKDDPSVRPDPGNGDPNG
jgi:1A family penicillin-binding protein